MIHHTGSAAFGDHIARWRLVQSQTQGQGRHGRKVTATAHGSSSSLKRKPLSHTIWSSRKKYSCGPTVRIVWM